MSKARLHLILCSGDAGAEHRNRERSFQPSVIDGGKRTIEMSLVDPWVDLLDLFDASILVSQASYLAFLEASLAVLAPQDRSPATLID